MPGFDSWVRRSPGEGNGNLLEYSFLENSMDREAWWVLHFHFSQVQGNNTASQRVRNENEVLEQEWDGCRTSDFQPELSLCVGCLLYGALWNLSGYEIRIVPSFPMDTIHKYKTYSEHVTQLSMQYIKLAQLQLFIPLPSSQFQQLYFFFFFFSFT